MHVDINGWQAICLILIIVGLTGIAVTQTLRARYWLREAKEYQHIWTNKTWKAYADEFPDSSDNYS